MIDKAIAVYKMVLELDPRCRKTHQDLGIAYVGQGRFPEGISALLKARELGLKDSGLDYHLALAYDGLGRIDQAVVHLKQARGQESSRTQAAMINIRLGALQFEKGTFGAALETLLQADGQKPQDLNVYLQLARTCDEKGAPEDAIRWYRKAADLKPQPVILAEIDANLALIYLSYGFVDAAAQSAVMAKELGCQSGLDDAVLGIAMLATGKYQSAILHLQKRADLYPDDAFTLHHLGLAFQQSSRVSETAERCRETLAGGTEDPETLCLLGRCHLSCDRPKEAIETLEKSVAVSREYYRAYKPLAHAYESAGEGEKAMDSYRSFLEFKPKPHAEDYLDFAELCARHGSQETVTAAFKTAMELKDESASLKPSDIGSHVRLGAIFLEMGRHAEAIFHLETHLIFEPEDMESRRLLGETCLAMGSYRKAMAAFSHSENRDAAISKDLLALSEAHLCREAYDEAIRVGLKSLAVNPQDGRAHRLLGKGYAAKGLYDLSAEAYLKAIAAEPNRQETHVDLSAVYGAMGQWGEAVDCLERAVKINPHDAKALRALGKAYEGMGKSDEAEKYFSRAEKVKKKRSRFAFKAGETIPTAEELDRIITEFKSLSEQDPDSPAAQKALGRAYRQKGLNDEAIYYLKKALKLDPDDAETYAQLGAAYDAKGRSAAALVCFEESLLRVPDNPECLLAVAEYHIQEGDITAAADYCGKLRGLSLEPGMALRREACCAEVCRAQGEHEEARVSYLCLIKEHGVEDIDVHRGLVECCLAVKDYGTAIDSAGIVLEHDDEDVRAHRLLGRAYCTADKYEEAVPHLRKAIEADPDDAESLNELAYITHFKPDILSKDEAFLLSEKALALRPDSGKAQVALGGSLLKQGGTDVAIVALEKAIKEGLESSLLEQANLFLAQAHFAKGGKLVSDCEVCRQACPEKASESRGFKLLSAFCCFTIGHQKEALQRYKDAAESEPDCGRSFSCLGSASAINGDYRDAVAAFERSIEREDENDRDRLGIYCCRLALGEPADIVSHWGRDEQLLRIDIGGLERDDISSGKYTQDIRALYTRAICQDSEKAEEELERAAGLFLLHACEQVLGRLVNGVIPPYSLRMLPFIILTLAYRMAGLEEEAAEACRKAGEADPLNPADFHCLLNETTLGASSPEMMELLKAKVKKDPGDIDSALKLTDIYLEKMEHELALAYCQLALKVNPENAQANFYAGVCYEKKELTYAARLAWEQAAASDPDGEWGEQARARLKDPKGGSEK